MHNEIIGKDNFVFEKLWNLNEMSFAQCLLWRVFTMESV